MPGGTDLATLEKVIEQGLEKSDTPAREKGLLLELLAYESRLKKEVIEYSGA